MNGNSLFARDFKPEADALYVTAERWKEFCREPSERLLEPDLNAAQGVDLYSQLRKIAVPEALFSDIEAINCTPEREMWFVHLETQAAVPYW